MGAKINVRGELNALAVDKTLTLPKGACKASTVRFTATSLKTDTGKTFSVSVKEDTIVVTRKS